MTLPTSACHSTGLKELRDLMAASAARAGYRNHTHARRAATPCTSGPSAEATVARASRAACRPSQGAAPCQTQMIS
jgi:hypothetical protein